MTTIQTGIKQATTDVMQHAFFLGGLDARRGSLERFTPLRTGYGRIFFTRMPRFLADQTRFKPLSDRFKHYLEYNNVGVDGLQNLNLETESVQGGYAARQIELPNNAKDDTNEVTVKVIEVTGSPMREFLDLWINGISDQHVGLAHYQGAFDVIPGIEYKQSNHTAEAIYVSTDPSGRSQGIEYACQLVNMMPKTVRKDQFNYEPGQHPTVQLDIPFTCVKYESPQINMIGKALLDKYKLLGNSYNFQSGYKVVDGNVLDNVDNTNLSPDVTIAGW